MSMRPTPDQDLERLLSPDRGEFGGLYDRLARTEPPRRLDRAVLAEASRAVLGRAPRSQRWMLGLGSAAGVILAAGIAWQVAEQIESRNGAPADAARSSAPQVVPVQPITPHEPSAVEAERVAPAVPAMPDAAASKAEPPAERRARRPAVARPAAPAPPPAAPAEVAGAPPEREAQAFSADAPAPVSKRERAIDAAADAGVAPAGRTDAEAASAASEPGVRRQRGGTAAPAPLTSVQLRQNMHLAPQDWLAEIHRLNREGRRQQAIENLRLFQRMHPDWQIGDELRQLLE